MRIGFDIGPITRRRTGVGNYCFSLLKALLDLPEALEIRGFSAGLPRPSLGPLAHRMTYRRLPVPTRAMYAIWNAVGLPAVDRLLGGVNVYHATNYFLPPTVRARRVLSIYDLAFLTHPQLCSPKVVGPFSRSMSRFAREADVILAASESTKRDITRLLQVPREKIRVAYGAASDSIQRAPHEEAARYLASRYGVEGPFVLFVGTLEPRKNVTGLVRAFQKAAVTASHRLVLLGAMGWRAQETLAALDGPARAGWVVRPGFVPPEDLPLFYSAADVFVFPSHYEGFGLPVLEAMTCGCPVITSNTSSLPEAGGSAALYCAPEDIDGLAEAIRRVLEDPALRSRMISEGRHQARRFSWRACAEATLAAYREVTA